jgi:hypothetical protein
MIPMKFMKMFLKTFSWHLLACLCFLAPSAVLAEPVKVIIDSDIGPDCDDSGAVAVANALVNMHEAEVLAMACCTSSDYGAPCLASLNAYFGHPDIPVGTMKGETLLPDSAYNRARRGEMANAIKKR